LPHDVMVSAVSIANEDEPGDPALKVTGVGYVRVGRMRANVIVTIRITCLTTSW